MIVDDFRSAFFEGHALFSPDSYRFRFEVVDVVAYWAASDT